MDLTPTKLTNWAANHIPRDRKHTTHIYTHLTVDVRIKRECVHVWFSQTKLPKTNIYKYACTYILLPTRDLKNTVW